jgi:hypothetical protein
MRFAISLLALLLASPLAAQSGTAAPAGGGAGPATSGSQDTDPIASWLDSLARDAHGLAISRSSVREGDLQVGAGDTVAGSIAAYHGTLEVYGHVRGNAVAAGGDVVLHPGSEVGGDALSVGGEVRNEGGTVGGETRSLSDLTVGPPTAAAPASTAQTARRAVSLSVGWYLVLALIGLAVVLFARSNLEIIAERIRTDFTKSFLYGLAGHILFVPALVVGVAASAITVIGIVLIPFIIVGFFLAAAGALALGFIAMSFVIGDAAMRWRGAAGGGGRAQLLQFLIVGLSIFLVLWVIAGALTSFGAIGGLVRFVCMVLTWVAVTTGFGATLASRGGTRSLHPPMLEEIESIDDLSWQTPTPVSGVAAARRPPSSERER